MKKIAVMIGGLVADNQRRILEGIYKNADEEGIQVYTFTCHVFFYKNRVMYGAHQIYGLPDLSLFDGVVFTPNSIWNKRVLEDVLKQVSELGIPAVSVNYEQPGIASIVGEDYRGSYELAEHLISVHGARSFWYLSGPVHSSDSAQRKAAFLGALSDHDISIDADCIVEGSYTPESGIKALKYWQQRFDKLPDAIVCANDSMALGVLTELDQQGFRMPEDVIVTGVDNSREARYSYPMLTTMERGGFSMGAEAVRILEKAWRGIKIADMRVEYSSRLVIGASCGCEPENRLDIAGYMRDKMKDEFYEQRLAMLVKTMSTEVTGARSFDELIKLLKLYVAKTRIPYFYLCMCDLEQVFAPEPAGDELDGSDERLINGCTDQITVPLAYENGAFTKYGAFPKGQVLPDEVMERGASMHYVAVPLHHQNETFGYCVFGDCDFPMEHIMCYTWIQIISSAIQNVRCSNRLQVMVHRLNEMWIHDPLTQVYNRAGFFQKAKDLQQKAAKAKTGIYVLFLDMDGLKHVNDTYGHEMGDRYITRVADILKKVTEEDELVMRYGGDEFAVMGLYRDYIREDELMQLIEQEIAKANEEEKQYPMSVSMGGEGYPDGGEVNIERILELADQKMYEQKRRKKQLRS